MFAQLGYIDEPRLSSVLAANYASTLQVGAVAVRMLLCTLPDTMSAFSALNTLEARRCLLHRCC